MKSPTRPLTLACSRLDEELAKALFRMVIMIRPGAIKVAKATPPTAGRAPPTATTKTII